MASGELGADGWGDEATWGRVEKTEREEVGGEGRWRDIFSS